MHRRPVVTPVWEHSVHVTADWSAGIPIGGEIPSWMGRHLPKGVWLFTMVMLFVVSRKVRPHLIQVLDAENR
jgi:hypothetical protein